MAQETEAQKLARSQARMKHRKEMAEKYREHYRNLYKMYDARRKMGKEYQSIVGTR